MTLVVAAARLIAAALAMGAVALLASFRFVRDFEAVGLALTTTALGTLLPIPHDTKMLAAGSGGTCWPPGRWASCSRSSRSRCS
ncbi:MAG: hypothetical protein ACRDPO_22335 [Streptosporangiaceae bacterium]